MTQLSPETIELIEKKAEQCIDFTVNGSDQTANMRKVLRLFAVDCLTDPEILLSIKGSEWMSVDSDDKSNVRYPRQQTQPVPSKEVQENQTHGEFMRSNPEVPTTSTTDIEEVEEFKVGDLIKRLNSDGEEIGFPFKATESEIFRQDWYKKVSTPSTTDTQDGKLNETFYNYGYPTDGGILGTEVSVKIDNQSNEETPSTTDIEKEAMELYPIKYEHSIGQRLINEEHKFKQQAHIKAYQMHRNDGLDQLIEWMEWESHRRWNESHELPDFTEILTKANEIKEQINKQP